MDDTHVEADDDYSGGNFGVIRTGRFAIGQCSRRTIRRIGILNHESDY